MWALYHDLCLRRGVQDDARAVEKKNKAFGWPAFFSFSTDQPDATFCFFMCAMSHDQSNARFFFFFAAKRWQRPQNAVQGVVGCGFMSGFRVPGVCRGVPRCGDHVALRNIGSLWNAGAQSARFRCFQHFWGCLGVTRQSGSHQFWCALLYWVRACPCQISAQTDPRNRVK